MSAAAQPVTYNLLVRQKGSGHYVAAGQKTIPEAASPGTEIEWVFAGRTIRGVIAHVSTPPGCDEHCIGTLFVRET